MLKHLMGYSYRELEFALLDSASMQRFARVDPFRVPKKSALQSAISAIDGEGWRTINGVLLLDAKERRIESGTQVRIDSTVTETDILEPSDSGLLYDGVRVLTRLLRLGTQADAGGVVARPLPCRQAAHARNRVAAWCPAVRGYLELLQRVVDQTKRRVFAGETVPASEKVVSLFEPHTDIIRKGGRATHYGHKINLTTGRSSLVRPVVVETGNPADSERSQLTRGRGQTSAPQPLAEADHLAGRLVVQAHR